MTERESILNVSDNILGEKYSFTSLKPNEEKQIIKPLGEGGSGIVYLADQLFGKGAKSRRAIKFFIYRDDLMKDYGYVSNDNFEVEILNITLFNHQNILKVIDGGYIKTSRTDIDAIPYTITEYISDLTLGDLLDAKNSERFANIFDCEEKVFNLFMQLLEGVSYLHSQHFYHCDIAPKNIFIKLDNDKNGDGFSAIIGDLGAGKTLYDGMPKGRLRVIGTKDYMPDDVLIYKNEIISCEQFITLQPKWDLFGIVKSMKEVISTVNRNIFCSYDKWYLERLNEQIETGEFFCVKELINIVVSLRPSNRKIMNIDELSEASKNIRMNLLSVHPIYATHRIRAIYKHEMMIRLMDVSQLLEGSTTFPSANHTRFEHSLGTYELMRKALLSLLRNKEYAGFLSERIVITGLLAALLSSLTSFPYSYIVSELHLSDNDVYPKINSNDIFDLIINEKSLLTNKSLSDLINTYFSEDGIQIDDIKYVAFGKTHGRKKDLDVLKMILNSSVGVRVVDYLTRDSHHIGLSYSIDTDGLFKSMAINNEKFYLTSKGVSVAEQIISNRYWMFKRIYWCDPNRANAAIIKYIFYTMYIEHQYENEPNEFEDELFEGITSRNENETIDFLLGWALKSGNKKVESMVTMLKWKGMVRFRSILVLNQSSSNDPHRIWQYFSEITYRQLYTIRNQIEEALISKFCIPRMMSEGNVLVLVDIPKEKSNAKLGSDIDTRRPDASIVRLSQVSGITKGLSESFDEQLRWLRIYIHPDLSSYFDSKNIKINEVSDYLILYLNELT